MYEKQTDQTNIHYGLFAMCKCTLRFLYRSKNPVVIGNARFTFITPGLVRMEYALDGKFVNEPTLFAIKRDTSFRDFRIEKTTANHYTLSTSSMRIDYLDNGFPFGQTNLSVHFRNQGPGKNLEDLHGHRRRQSWRRHRNSG